MAKKRGRPPGMPNKTNTQRISKKRGIYSYLRELEEEGRIFFLSQIYPMCEPQKYVTISFKLPIVENPVKKSKKIIENKVYLTPIQNRVIKLLRKNGSMYRTEIGRELKIERTTIYDNLLKLQKRKLVEKFSRNNGKRGRPIVYWKIKEGTV